MLEPGNPIRLFHWLLQIQLKHSLCWLLLKEWPVLLITVNRWEHKLIATWAVAVLESGDCRMPCHVWAAVIRLARVAEREDAEHWQTVYSGAIFSVLSPCHCIFIKDITNSWNTLGSLRAHHLFVVMLLNSKPWFLPAYWEWPKLLPTSKPCSEMFWIVWSRWPVSEVNQGLVQNVSGSACVQTLMWFRLLI